MHAQPTFLLCFLYLIRSHLPPLRRQVDVLVSEPMGTLLVNERMIESYTYARDKFLKPGGAHCCLFFVVVYCSVLLRSSQLRLALRMEKWALRLLPSAATP